MGADVGSTKAGSVKSEINVTPLVDVVLVLLIIFMVVTPMLQKGQAVQMPVASNPDKKPDDKSQILVAISKDQKIWIDKEQTDTNSFPSRIKESFDRNPSGNVMIKADARLTYGDVKKVILDVRDAGFKNVGLIAQKKDSTK